MILNHLDLALDKFITYLRALSAAYELRLNDFKRQIQINLTKLTVSRDLLRSTVTNQIVFGRQDSNIFPKFERMTDRCSHVLVSKLETLDAIIFT